MRRRSITLAFQRELFQASSLCISLSGDVPLSVFSMLIPRSPCPDGCHYMLSSNLQPPISLPPQPASSSDSEVGDIDPVAGSDAGEDEESAVAAIPAAATEKMESDEESDKGSDHSGLKRKSLAMKVHRHWLGETRKIVIICV